MGEKVKDLINLLVLKISNKMYFQLISIVRIVDKLIFLWHYFRDDGIK